MAQNKYLQEVNRAPGVTVLPDLRHQIQRRYDIVDWQATFETLTEFEAAVQLPWGTEDDEYSGLRLIKQDVVGSTENPNKSPNDPPPYLIRVYETVDANDRTQVGRTDISYDQYGRKTVVESYIQLSDGTTVYTDVVGTSPAPAPNDACILQKFEAPNDGTLIRWKLTYIDSGELSDVETLRFDGKLVIRELTYLNEVPPTPSNFTLVTQSIEFVEGLKVYKYGFASAASALGLGGQISIETEYILSADAGVTGVTYYTIKYLTDPSVVVNPIPTPAGTVLIDVVRENSDGYVMWTGKYAKGTGTIASDLEIKEDGNLIIYRITAINAAPSAPSPTIGGTVVLINTEVRNGSRFESGVVVYVYTWAEGNGQIDLDVQGNGDGSLIYRVTDLNVAIATPAYPGSGTAYLVNLKNEARDGCYLNVATYHKPPATVTLNQTTQFEKPGSAVFTGSPPQLVLTPPVTLTLLAEMEVSYDTAQITDVPFSVTQPASFFESYTPTATGVPVTSTQSLGRYLAGASSISGTASVYNGVLCDTWSATLLSSSPSSFSSGAKVLHTHNEIYLTDVNGVVVYRRTKVSYTF